MKTESKHPHKKRLILVIATCFVYAAISFISDVWLDGQFPAFGIVPILTAAWLYGLPGGLIAALVVVPANSVLLDMAFQDPAFLTPLTIFLILLGAITGRLSDVHRDLKRKLLERDQAELKSYAYEQELRDVVSDQVVESRPMARMLETGICEDLKAVQDNLFQVKEKFDVIANCEVFQAAEAGVEAAVRDSRSLVFQLDPESLLEIGFQGALSWLAKHAQESYGLSCQLEDDGHSKNPPKQVALVILQAVRELLANEGRHGRGTQVKIRVRQEADSLQITLDGKGLGFDASPSQSEALLVRQVGLEGLKEDLDAVGGMLQIESDGGRTRVLILAPLK